MPNNDQPTAQSEEGKRDLPAWAKYVLGGVGGALLAGAGGIWANYSDFRKSIIEANSKATEQTIQASDELKPVIDKFIQVHIGKAQSNDKDKEALRIALRNAYEKAENVKNRWNGLEEPFKSYATSLVELKKAADSLKGPFDGGKAFSHAYSNYIVADQNWRSAAQRKQNSYIASF